MYPQRQSNCKVLVNGSSKQPVKRPKTPTKSQLTKTTSNLAQHSLNPLEEKPKYNPKMYSKTTPLEGTNINIRVQGHPISRSSHPVTSTNHVSNNRLFTSTNSLRKTRSQPLIQLVASTVTIEFNDSAESEEEEEEEAGSRTNWNDMSSHSKWFTDPPHLTDVGGRKSKHEILPDQSLIQDYVSTLEKLDNLRTTRAEIEELDDDLSAKAELTAARAELAKSYTSHIEVEDIEVPKPRVWTDPGVASNSTPYRGSLASLRLNALRLEERRLLEIRRLQELERLRGPQKHWYELKTPQFCVEARKNNELLSAKKSWSGMREYTEDVWKSRDLTRGSGDCTF